MSGTGLYAYAIARGLSPADLADEPGIGDVPLGLVEHEGLAAVVSEVDLAEFGEEGLRRNLEDLRWVETVAFAHDRVVRRAAGHAPTAPLRLATVFVGEDSVRGRLEEWHDSAERALDRIEGRSEWSVKAFADPAARSVPEPEEPVAPGTGAGKAFLMKRRAATQQRQAAVQQDASIAAELHETLGEVAVSARRLAPQDRQLSGHEGEMILNGTYLVDNADDAVAAFEAAVARIAGTHEHIRVQLGGPWPPYSFSSLDAP